MIEAQHQIDSRAIELAAAAQKEVMALRESLATVAAGLQDHVKSCTASQTKIFYGVIGLLICMLGVLINLYVLHAPH